MIRADLIKKFKIDWILFFILFMLYVIYTPNTIIGVDFQLLLFIFLIIYLKVFGRLYLINNSVLLQNDEKKNVIIGTLFFIAVIFISLSIKTGTFAPVFKISLYTLFQTLTEELVFRVFLLSVIIEDFRLTQFKKYPFYWTEGKKNSFVLLVFMLLISILFADVHRDWLTSNLNLVIRSVQGLVFPFAFVLTNKKVYAPWFIHYIINRYAYP